MVSFRKIIHQVSRIGPRKAGNYRHTLYRVEKSETVPADFLTGTDSEITEIRTEISGIMHPFMAKRWGDVTEDFGDFILATNIELTYDDDNENLNDEIEYNKGNVYNFDGDIDELKVANIAITNWSHVISGTAIEIPQSSVEDLETDLADRFSKSNDTLDDIDDGKDYIRVGGVSDSHQITDDSIGDLSISKGKISTAGTWAASDIPNLDASKITTGTFNDDRLSSNIFKLNKPQRDLFIEIIFAFATV